jgi:hypothetical protein
MTSWRLSRKTVLPRLPAKPGLAVNRVLAAIYT